MRSLKLTVCYEGTAYAGWQVQPEAPSVQEALERTWRKITGETLRITASGRTDAGVHALGQVASLATETHLSNEVLQRALCAELPPDIAVLAVEDAPPGFHAIRDARSKRYRYQIHNGPTRPVFDRHFVWHVPGVLDTDKMRRAARSLVGRHDFSGFESAGAERASSVRTVSELTVVRDDERSERITIEIEADGFLYNMVRTIVGTLVEVGRGAEDESWPGEVLAACDRKKAGPTTPPQGLFLVKVEYE